MISSSLRIPEFDFLGMFGGRVRGRGGREVTTGSKFILRARLSKDPLLLFSEVPLLLFLDPLSVVLVVVMVSGVVASMLLLLLAVVRSMLLEVTMLEFEDTSSSTVVGTAYVVRASSATVRGTWKKAFQGDFEAKVHKRTLCVSISLLFCNHWHFSP